MAKTVHDYDENKIKDTKEDIDTLLVFVGCFPPLSFMMFDQRIIGWTVLSRTFRIPCGNISAPTA